MKHRKQFPNATPYTDARGKRRWRYRKGGKSFELGTAYGSDEFIRRYQAAIEGAKVRGVIGADRVRHGTVNDLVARFYVVAFAGDRLSEGTKRSYRGIIERFREEHGDKRVEGLKAHHIETMIARKADTPNAANNFRKRLAQLLDLAVRMEWLPTNPARVAKSLKVEGGGHYTWGEADITQFYAAHPPGTLPHRAMTLMLWTGAAKVDAVKLGWFSIKGTGFERRLEYVRQKTRRTSGTIVRLPIHPELEAVLALCPTEASTFLQTAYGKPRSAAGLGNEMRRWCDEAGLPECTSHGLRKAIARRLADARATGPQIIAVTGHKTIAEAEPYLRDISRSDLADSALALLGPSPKPEQNVVNLAEKFAKKPSKSLKGNAE